MSQVSAMQQALKERDDVDNWRAYIFKLLRKEDGDLSAALHS